MFIKNPQTNWKLWFKFHFVLKSYVFSKIIAHIRIQNHINRHSNYSINDQKISSYCARWRYVAVAYMRNCISLSFGFQIGKCGHFENYQELSTQWMQRTRHGRRSICMVQRIHHPCSPWLVCYSMMKRDWVYVSVFEHHLAMQKRLATLEMKINAILGLESYKNSEKG